MPEADEDYIFRMSPTVGFPLMSVDQLFSSTYPDGVANAQTMQPAPAYDLLDVSRYLLQTRFLFAFKQIFALCKLPSTLNVEFLYQQLGPYITHIVTFLADACAQTRTSYG